MPLLAMEVNPAEQEQEYHALIGTGPRSSAARLVKSEFNTKSRLIAAQDPANVPDPPSCACQASERSVSTVVYPSRTKRTP
jgi:hypothetical protein